MTRKYFISNKLALLKWEVHFIPKYGTVPLEKIVSNDFFDSE